MSLTSTGVRRRHRLPVIAAEIVPVAIAVVAVDVLAAVAGRVVAEDVVVVATVAVVDTVAVMVDTADTVVVADGTENPFTTEDRHTEGRESSRSFEISSKDRFARRTRYHSALPASAGALHDGRLSNNVFLDVYFVGFNACITAVKSCSAYPLASA